MANLEESLNQDLNTSLVSERIFSGKMLTSRGEQLVQSHFQNLEHKLDTVYYYENMKIVRSVLLIGIGLACMEVSGKDQLSSLLNLMVIGGMFVSLLDLWFYHALNVEPLVDAMYELKSNYNFLKQDSKDVKINTGRQSDIEEN